MVPYLIQSSSSSLPMLHLAGVDGSVFINLAEMQIAGISPLPVASDSGSSTPASVVRLCNHTGIVHLETVLGTPQQVLEQIESRMKELQERSKRRLLQEQADLRKQLAGVGKRGALHPLGEVAFSPLRRPYPPRQTPVFPQEVLGEVAADADYQLSDLVALRDQIQAQIDNWQE